MRVAENKRVAIDGGDFALFHVAGQKLCHRAGKPNHHIAAKGLPRRGCPDPGMRTRVVPPPIQFLFLFLSPALRAPSQSATCSSTFAWSFCSTWHASFFI